MFVIGDAIFSVSTTLRDQKIRDSEHDAGDAMPEAPARHMVKRKIGDTYDPDLLPDHRGSYFDHRVSKLVQRDHRDEDGKLIVPHELYSQLTEGTLFCARFRFETFIFKGDRASKVYHIYVERLQVLDKGSGNVWSPPVPSLLAASAPSTPRKRTREEPEADDAFDSFKGISPKKKTRASA
ncbi:hypothetical protein B0H10DRAFT_2442150 [Mycena sp. CBHHK59/15]|nr:hypothetical protein B0H10DRAFT_2442150 [Mycena sp. CBHHK59/15]